MKKIKARLRANNSTVGALRLPAFPGVMNEEDSAVEKVVESSLTKLKDEHAEAPSGPCPEDVPIPSAAALRARMNNIE